MEKRHVIVTGAAGLLGIEMVTQARKRGIPVIAIDDGSAGTWHRLAAFQNDLGVSCFKADVCDFEALSRVWPTSGPADVVDLAARHFIPACEANPLTARQVNVQGTANVLALAETHTTGTFILASTADVHAWRAELHDEHDPVSPSTVYGRTKAQAETLVAAAARRRPETRFLAASRNTLLMSSPNSLRSSTVTTAPPSLRGPGSCSYRAATVACSSFLAAAAGNGQRQSHKLLVGGCHPGESDRKIARAISRRYHTPLSPAMPDEPPP